ncbi:MAG: hypothetical protein M0017_05085 [Desulfobacteraceae bacterium]|nr:hypothetical protein [Desulfobacteraceae bacterium]
MGVLLSFAYIMVGIALGAGADWLYWRGRFRQAGQQANAASEELRRESDGQLQAAESRLAETESALAAGSGKIAALEQELAGVRDQKQGLEAQLAAETRKLGVVQTLNGRIPTLEGILAGKEEAIAQLTAEKNALHERVAALLAEIEEEKRSLQETLYFVEGRHYLPGKVVRNLTGRTEVQN